MTSSESIISNATLMLFFFLVSNSYYVGDLFGCCDSDDLMCPVHRVQNNVRIRIIPLISIISLIVLITVIIMISLI